MNNIPNETKSENILEFIKTYLHDFLNNIGLSENWISHISLAIILTIVIVIAISLKKLTGYLITFSFNKIHKTTKISFFYYALKNKFAHYIALIITYTFIVNIIPFLFYDYPSFIKPLLKITDIYIVFLIIWTVTSIVKSFINILQEKPALRNKPMQSYLQVIQIILYLIGAVLVFSILTGKSATVFFTAMGAASAILLLMFKDTIMGFVSSIQISINEMVMIGDWITMSKYGADGDVEEITLTTVKVRNFDKTITSIPTYALISDSFQNWRGMQDSGGRRIKRALMIKQSSIKALSDEELEVFEKMDFLESYIKDKRKVYSDLNKKLSLNKDGCIKGFSITNCDLFIYYVTWYLRNHPNINQNLTLLVRELAPTTEGLPVEIYTFTNTTVWNDYERISGEIMNHLISNINNFKLDIFESVSGTDINNIALKNKS